MQIQDVCEAPPKEQNTVTEHLHCQKNAAVVFKKVQRCMQKRKLDESSMGSRKKKKLIQELCTQLTEEELKRTHPSTLALSHIKANWRIQAYYLFEDMEKQAKEQKTTQIELSACKHIKEYRKAVDALIESLVDFRIQSAACEVLITQNREAKQFTGSGYESRKEWDAAFDMIYKVFKKDLDANEENKDAFIAKICQDLEEGTLYEVWREIHEKGEIQALDLDEIQEEYSDDEDYIEN